MIQVISIGCKSYKVAEPTKCIAVFLVVQTLYLIGIGSVELLASDKRNMNTLRVHLGFDPWKTTIKSAARCDGVRQAFRQRYRHSEKTNGYKRDHAVPFKRTIICGPLSVCLALLGKGLVNRD